MNLAATPEQQRAWMAQWRLAAIALEEVKREELQAMTEEQACAASDTLLQAIPFPQPPSWRDHHSGLVEQQCIFHKDRPPR